jgi:1-aminocyclopropane-1-carboxylate deaminase
VVKSTSNFIDSKKSELQRLEKAAWTENDIQVFVKRDDLLHPEISGNKWRKLKYNVEQAIHLHSEGIFTFGGAYSNHLVATAAACKEFGLKSIGFVRGEELNADSNDTLKRCAELGMELQFLSREMYFLNDDKMFVDELKLENPRFYAVPEGGGNYYGIVGCQEIWKEIPKDIDHVFLAQGTAATSCGVLLGMPDNCQLHVIPALKGFNSIDTMKSLFYGFFLDDESLEELFQKVTVHSECHFGGYAKYTPELLQFIQDVYKTHKLPLDPIYTAKAFYAMTEELKKPMYFGKKIVFIHTGGLQGVKAIQEKENIQFFE